jgi:hypothetical protein
MVSSSDSKQITAHKVWRLCEDANGFVKSKEFIMRLEETGKFTKAEAQKLFANMEMECEIKIQPNNTWKKTTGSL